MNSDAMKLPVCISGAACWVRNFSATVVEKQAIAAAMPIIST